jgi:hypothetical protein
LKELPSSVFCFEPRLDASAWAKLVVCKLLSATNWMLLCLRKLAVFMYYLLLNELLKLFFWRLWIRVGLMPCQGMW